MDSTPSKWARNVCVTGTFHLSLCSSFGKFICFGNLSCSCETCTSLMGYSWFMFHRITRISGRKMRIFLQYQILSKTLIDWRNFVTLTPSLSSFEVMRWTSSDSAKKSGIWKHAGPDSIIAYVVSIGFVTIECSFDRSTFRVGKSINAVVIFSGRHFRSIAVRSSLANSYVIKFVNWSSS